jgi:alkanesulfonate monooxygenase SsuD/methylene tetrahydromethanopterin reductase-like flavin-dependent oxidoreductase (luciferase family)
MRSFRFGVNVRSAHSRAEWQEKARRVETLGYDTLNTPDHLADLLAPLPSIISAAEATTHLRLGTNVLNNDLRHPVLVAREAATADLLTDGRFQLGLGAGAIRSEYEQAGLGFDRGATRVERLSEAVVTEDRRKAAEELTGRWSQLSAGEILNSPYVLIGTIDQIVRDLQSWRHRWGFSYYVVQEPWMDALAPVVAELAGK